MKTSSKNVVALAVAASLSMLPSCKKYTQEQLDLAVSQAATQNYNLGYQDGKVDGYALGLQDGYAKAVADFADGNLSAVYNQGFNTGYNTGYVDGDANGYADGYNAGKSDGYSLGYNAGYDKGVNDGFNSGYNQGVIVGYNDGYDDGYFDGYDDGSYDSYTLGYDDGYGDGYVDGYDDGWFDAGGGVIGSGSGFSAGQGKLTVAEKMVGDVVQSIFDFKGLKSPKAVLAEASSKNSDLARFLNSAGTSVLSKNVILEQYLVTSLQKQLQHNYGMQEERAMKVANLANKFIRSSGEREISSAEASLMAKEVLGSDVASITSAVDASAVGDASALDNVVKTAAEVNQISEEQAKQILLKLFI